LILDDRIKKTKKLNEYANKLDVKMAALSIAWCLKNPYVTTAILGATKKEQLLDNLKAIEILPRLTPEVMERIDKIMQTKPGIPEY